MTIVLPVRTRRVRRRRDAAGAEDAAPVTTDRAPRVARMLALAHHWRGLIRDGVVKDQAALARLVGVSRARVTQVMDLLYLAPDIQEEILDMKHARLSKLRHADVTRLAAVVDWSEQHRAWRTRTTL